jgi:undecaprenyl-diphosphatase
MPAALVGLFLYGPIAALFDSPRAASAGLLVTSAMLVVAEKASRPSGRALGVRGALAIGTGQALAIMPGVSRAGSTIAAGQLSGLDRQEATRFSFLLAAPILLGAGSYEVLRTVAVSGQSADWAAIAVGSATAFVVGITTIGWLLRFVGRHTLLPFALYTAALGIVGLFLLD